MPQSCLVSLQRLFSLVSQVAIIIAFQVAAYCSVQAQDDWFVQFDRLNPCYRNTTAEQEFRDQVLLSLYSVAADRYEVTPPGSGPQVRP